MKKTKGSWWSNRHRDYKRKDKMKGRDYNLTLQQAKAIMQLPCYYCTAQFSKGIDRLDNNLGHIEGNCVPCCEKCNIILSTLPLNAKMEMREALRQIHVKGLLKDWEPAYKTKKDTKDDKELKTDPS